MPAWQFVFTLSTVLKGFVRLSRRNQTGKCARVCYRLLGSGLFLPFLLSHCHKRSSKSSTLSHQLLSPAFYKRAYLQSSTESRHFHRQLLKTQPRCRVKTLGTRQQAKSLKAKVCLETVTSQQTVRFLTSASLILFCDE